MIQFMFSALIVVLFLAVFGTLIGNIIKGTLFLIKFLWPLMLGIVYIIAMINMMKEHGSSYESLVLGVIYTFTLLCVLVPIGYLQTKDRV